MKNEKVKAAEVIRLLIFYYPDIPAAQMLSPLTHSCSDPVKNRDNLSETSL